MYLEYEKIKLIDPYNKKYVQNVPSSWLTYAVYPFQNIETSPYALKLFDVGYRVN